MSCDESDKILSGTTKEVSSNRLIDFGGQNPSPSDPTQGAQDFQLRVRTLADQIMRTYFASLPSNYVSQTKGPLYSIQFQAAAEMLARFQLIALEILEDRDFDFTRPEFLFQTLGSLVFPNNEEGVPDIDGDITYREFLQRMVILLLQGSTSATVREGAGLLTSSVTTLLEKFKQGDTVRPENQFAFEINYESYQRTTPSGDPGHYHSVSVDCEGNGITTNIVCLGETCTSHEHIVQDWTVQEAEGHSHVLVPAFPELPFQLQRNVSLITRALKPAHTLYEHRHLFRELFGRYVERVLGDSGTNPLSSFAAGVFEDQSSLGMSVYEYEDVRKFCLGVKSITSSSGETLTDRTLFKDAARSFHSIRAGSVLSVLDGENQGTYEVREVLRLALPEDPTPRPYVTSSGLTGTAITTSGWIEDEAQDFSACVGGETFTFSGGPNAGTYLIDRVLGENGGPLGKALGPSSKIRLAPGLLRLDRRMPVSASGQDYSVSVDRLGVSTPKSVTGEDVSQFFYV